eukprot:2455252-Lingulodinium_polyedra.AAC.1
MGNVKHAVAVMQLAAERATERISPATGGPRGPATSGPSAPAPVPENAGTHNELAGYNATR